MHKDITLMDGVEQNAKYPDTFHIPTDFEKATVKVGHFVKLGFQYQDRPVERMWVLVTGHNTGLLNNDPFILPDVIKCDDPVEFEPKHIIAIME